MEYKLVLSEFGCSGGCLISGGLDNMDKMICYGLFVTCYGCLAVSFVRDETTIKLQSSYIRNRCNGDGRGVSRMLLVAYL